MLAFTAASSTIPVLIYATCQSFVALTLAGRIAMPNLKLVLGVTDIVTFTSAGLRVVVSSWIFGAIIVREKARIDRNNRNDRNDNITFNILDK